MAGFQELLDRKRPADTTLTKRPTDSMVSSMQGEVITDSCGSQATPGVISLQVPGVLPAIYGRNDRLIEPDNLEGKGVDIIDSIR